MAGEAGTATGRAPRRGMTFTTPVDEDNAYAGTLIHAALNRVSLSHY